MSVACPNVSSLKQDSVSRYVADCSLADFRKAKRKGLNWAWLIARKMSLREAGMQRGAMRTPSLPIPEVIAIALYNQGIGCTELARRMGCSRFGLSSSLESLGILRSKRAYLDRKIEQGAVTEGQKQRAKEMRIWVRHGRTKLRTLHKRMKAALGPLKTAKRALTSIKVYHRTKLWERITRKSVRGNIDRITYGCTIAELRKHIEAQWLPGMAWANHTQRGWHIDHIRPCASFDFSDLKQIRACFHYTNLRPLWAVDNMRKHAKWSATPSPVL